MLLWRQITLWGHITLLVLITMFCLWDTSVKVRVDCNSHLTIAPEYPFDTSHSYLISVLVTVPVVVWQLPWSVALPWRVADRQPWLSCPAGDWVFGRSCVPGRRKSACTGGDMTCPLLLRRGYIGPRSQKEVTNFLPLEDNLKECILFLNLAWFYTWNTLTVSHARYVSDLFNPFLYNQNLRLLLKIFSHWILWDFNSWMSLCVSFCLLTFP